MQNHFRCVSLQVGKRAHEKAGVHVTNNNTAEEISELALKPLTTKNGLSVSVLCTIPFL